MKTVVVYYSYTGNTKKVAEKIGKSLGCDILSLTPTVPFSTNYDEVVDTYQNNSIENVDVKINKVDVKDYDKIIICTPVWWYTICPVVTTFLKENDLTGKIVYPCATNAGWLGHTFKDFEKLCKNSILNEGKNIVFDDVKLDEMKTSEEEIDLWIESMR